MSPKRVIHVNDKTVEKYLNEGVQLLRLMEKLNYTTVCADILMCYGVALFTDLKSFFFVSLFFFFMLTCAYLCYLGTLVGFEHTCGDLGTICLQVYYEKQVLPNIVK